MKFITILLTIFLIFCVASSSFSLSEDPFLAEKKYIEEVTADIIVFLDKINWVLPYRANLNQIGERLQNKWNIPPERYYIELWEYAGEPGLYLSISVTSQVKLGHYYVLDIPIIDLLKKNM